MDLNIEERVASAQEYFRMGYNCSQAVILAFQDILGVDADVLERLSIGLGGGVGRMREVCGTVSGMAVVAGTLAAMKDPGAPSDGHKQKKAEAYGIVQELAGRFREENGSIVCHELLGLRTGQQSPVPEDRTAAYYKGRPCEALVGCSARLVAEYIQKNL